MTIANTFASKLAVGFVAVAMIFSLGFASTANAQSVEDLQAQITALLAQITSLQGQLGSSGGSSAAACTFTRALTMGSSGADVTCLQNYLISAGHAIAAGATGYFGAQTQAAVSAWQAANGVAPAAGYFGPVSQAKYSALMAMNPGSGDDDANDDANDDDSSTSLSGEASLDSDDLNDGDDTSIEEGQEDAPVAEYQVEFSDGDAMITRLDVTLVASGSEEDPWDTFEDVSLWVDGEEVARMAADDEDEYLDEDDGSLRFSNLDIVAMEDEELDIVIAVTVQGSVDDIPATWNVDVTGLRFVDGDDVTSTETITVDTVNFDIEAEGSDDEVIVKTSSEDPDATTISVEEDEKSDWTTIFAFDLDTDDSTNDIEVNEIPVRVVTPNDIVNQVVSDVQLVVDGEVYDDVTWTGASGSAATSTFDIDGDLVIEAGDRVTVEFQVEFKQLTGNFDEGDTILASTSGALGDFEGADDVTGEGSASSETHTLRSTGAILEPNTMTETLKVNNEGDTTDDEGVFTIKFDVTAFEDDIFVNKTAASGTTMGTAGANYTITKDGSVITTGTRTASLTSTADTEGTRFKVAEGETETFTLTVEFDPATSGFHQVRLYSFNFATSNADPTTQQQALPIEDYETDALSI